MKKTILLTFYLLSFFLISTAHASLALPALSNNQSLAPMLKQAMPAIVSITGYKRIKNTSNTAESPLGMGHPEEQISVMIGSGVIVDSKKGLIVTNSHVVAELEEIKVTLADNRILNAKLLGQDSASDIALLKIEANNLSAIPFADSDSLQVGDFVVAIGTPYGMNHTVTAGIVSALGRTDIGFEGYYDFIQTDAAINLGNSGGGLFNLKGELVGINTAIISPHAQGGIPTNTGLSLAIPINMARGIWGQLANRGFVDRGPLGVRAQHLTPELAKAFKVNKNNGAVLIDIIPNTAADKAGLLVGDILLEVNNKDVKDPAHLRTLISLIPMGEKAKIKFWRHGKLVTRNIVITNPNDYLTHGEQIFSGLAGGALENVASPTVQGVLVANIKKSSPIANSDLTEEDLIIEANNEVTPNLDALKVAADKNKDALLLKIMRKNLSFFVAIMPDKNGNPS